jgi:hypothetical protein
MPDINNLAGRIDAEFSAAAETIKRFRAENVEEYKQWQKRLEQLGRVFEEVRDIWRPRLVPSGRECRTEQDCDRLTLRHTAS